MSLGLALVTLEIGLLKRASARNTPPQDSPTNPGFEAKRGRERERGGIVIPKAHFSQLPRTNNSHT